MKYSLVIALLFSATTAMAQRAGGTSGVSSTGIGVTTSGVNSGTTTSGAQTMTTSGILNRPSNVAGSASIGTSPNSNSGTNINTINGANVSPSFPGTATTARCTTATGQSLGTNDLGYTNCTNMIKK